MSVNELKENAAKYVYELRKFFAEGESPITYYVCAENVVVISTKNLYIFFDNGFVDYSFDKLEHVMFGDCSNLDCCITIKDKTFHLVFQSKEALQQLLTYYDKWSK